MKADLAFKAKIVIARSLSVDVTQLPFAPGQLRWIVQRELVAYMTRMSPIYGSNINFL